MARTLNLTRDPRTTYPDGTTGIDFEAFRRMQAELVQLRSELPTDPDELAEAVDAILAFQREDGSFSFESDYRMDSDCRVEYVYRPSYACCQILMRAAVEREDDVLDTEGLLDGLRHGLEFCCGRGLAGHGFDSEKQQVEDLMNFVRAGYLEFERAYPGLCPAFSELVAHIVGTYEQRLAACNTIVGFGSDLTCEMTEVVETFGRNVQLPIFVYGTLMEGQSNARMLAGCPHFGAARLSGYGLFDLGAYPGIVPVEDDGHVFGEVRLVDARTLERLDELEGNGSLYDRVAVTVRMTGACIEKDRERRVWAYTYRGNVAPRARIEEQLQPWPRALAMRKTHVWYVAYGSNLLRERFMCYLAGGECAGNGVRYVGCDDPTPPVCDAAFPVMHDVYFGNSSSSWGGTGVAFLDADHPGFAYGRAYLITREQYEQVRKQEGRSPQWYGREVDLGLLGGIPVVTITSEEQRSHNAPSEDYLDVLRRGLRETYPSLDNSVINERLLEKCTHL